MCFLFYGELSSLEGDKYSKKDVQGNILFSRTQKGGTERAFEGCTLRLYRRWT